MKEKFIYLVLAVLTLFLVIPEASQADVDLEKIKKDLPKLLGANNQGMEFVLSFVPAYVDNVSPSTGVPGIYVYISSAAKANVKVRVPRKGWEKNYQIQPNTIQDVFIPVPTAQVGAKQSYLDVPEPAEVYPGGAVIVTSDVPIICYGLVRYPYTSDGYLAIPVASLGKEYVIASYNGFNSDPDSWYFTSYTAIVGAHDKTKVTFTYGGRSSGRVETSDGKILTPYKSDTKTLNKGDVWLIPARGNKPDITGSYVRADKPVACYSGNFCAYIPYSVQACDYIIEQDMPMHVWGTKYYVTPIKNRLYNSPIRIFASQNNTTVYRNGWSDQVVTVPNKYGTENEGWIEVRAAEGEPQAVTLLSDKRFNVVQYNPGTLDDNVDSDPFELSLTPIEQFQDHIIFNTPGIKGGFKFDVNYLNVVYQTTESGQIPEDLEMGLYTPLGEIVWTPIASKFDGDPGYEFIDPTNPTPERKYFCKQLKLPEDGVYQIRAKDKFAAYAYGFSWCDSYGFPTSVATIDLEKPDTVAPNFEYTIDCEGYVPNRSLASNRPTYVNDMPDEDSTRSNIGVIYFDKGNSYNYIFNHKPFVPGEDRYVEWGLTPVNPKLDARAVITFTDRAGNDTTVVIEHWATKLDITPHVKNFGKFKAGDVKSFPFKITNKSDAAFTKFTNLKLKNGNQGFKLTYTFNPDIPIAPGESRDFTVTFTAPTEGEFSDWIGIGDTCTFDYISNVQAGVGTPKITVSDAFFPRTTVGKEGNPITAVIKNTGNTQLVITGFTALHENVFRTDLADLNISPDNPAFLGANKELQFRVWFKPDAVNKYSDSIVFISDAGSVDDPVCLITGEGMEPALTATNENWLRKRVHLPKYDGAPFNFALYPAPMGGITLTNDGSQTTNMTKVVMDVANSTNPNAFKILKDGQFVNLIDNLSELNVAIESGQSVKKMVYFDPTIAGQHKLTINFESDAPTVTSVLEGVGIYPQETTQDADFGQVIIGAAPSEKMIRFTNDNWGPYADALTITGFTTSPAGAITTTYATNQPGTEGFVYNEAGIVNDASVTVAFPIVLQPGEYIDIPAKFFAQRYGDHNASITSVSDASIDKTANLKGFGITEGLVATPGFEPSICSNTTATIKVSLENVGTRDFTIEPGALYIDADATSSFSISNVMIDGSAITDWQNGFILKEKKKVEVTITYAPNVVSGATPHTANVAFKIDAIDQTLKTIKIPVSGRSAHFERSSVGELNGAAALAVSPDKGSGITYTVKVNAGADMSLANVTQYHVRIVHKRNFLDIRKDGGSFHIFKGEGLPADWAIVGAPKITLDGTTNEQTIDVTIGGPTKITQTTAFEALRIDFFAFLPWFKDSETGLPTQSKDSATIISHYIDDNDQCVDYVNPTYPTATLNPVCADPIRSIEISSNSYGLSKIVPNPIDARGGEIQFENAFDNEEVQMNIFNSNNELVATLVNGSMKAGKHSVRIPIETLSSGAYTCQIVAGPFRAAEPLVIVK